MSLYVFKDTQEAITAKKNIFLFVVMYLFFAGRSEFEISGGGKHTAKFQLLQRIYLHEKRFFISVTAKVIVVLFNKNKNYFYRSYNSHYCLLFNVFSKTLWAEIAL